MMTSTIKNLTILGAVMLLLAPQILDAFAADLAEVTGIVRDARGAAVSEVEVSLLSTQQVLIAVTRTNGAGRFVFAEVPRGSYLVRAWANGFPEGRVAVQVSLERPEPLELRLETVAVEQTVTVTADPGEVAEVQAVSQPVNIIDSR